MTNFQNEANSLVVTHKRISDTRMKTPIQPSDTDIDELFTWLDTFPLNRAKKHIAREFSDGVAVAEMLHYLYPKMIDLHNYIPANSSPQKMGNWATLQLKVFRKLKLYPPKELIENIVHCQPGYIELFLIELRKRIEEYNYRKTYGKYRMRSNHSQYSNDFYLPPIGHPTGYAVALQPPPIPQHLIDEQHAQGKEQAQLIFEMKDTIRLLQLKVKRLEDLLRIKEQRQSQLMGRHF